VIFNIVAIALSAAALATSTYTALQHQALQKAVNFAPAYMQILRQYQTLDFHDHYRYVTTKLRTDHDPQLGISGLPDEARRAVYDIAYFFQGYGVLRLLRILDDQVLPTLQPRLIAVWEAIEPYVERERELHGFTGLYLLRVLEEFAKDAQTLPPGSLHTTLTRRRFVKIQRGLQAVGPQPRP
jgi:hypothetical protein